jgi:hypothetical protein
MTVDQSQQELHVTPKGATKATPYELSELKAVGGPC